jgi:hypothetical protein
MRFRCKTELNVPHDKGPQRLIISLHIPKTGGTSFSDVLERAYPGEVAFFYREKNKLTHPKLKDHTRLRDPELLAELEADGIKVIHGHAPGRWFLKGVPDQRQYWTWVRDPVERVISAYYYLVQRGLRGRERPGAQKVEGRTLEEYVRIEQNQNIQSRVLTGMDLSKMGFVGVTEHFDESLAMLGLSQHQLPKPRNRNKKKPEIDPELKRLIGELNAEDVALYEEAVRLFDQRRAAA